MTYNLIELEKDVTDIMINNQVPEITTEIDYTKAGDVAKFLKNKVKALDDKRKEYTLPLFNQKKKIDDDFKKLIEPLENIINQITSKQKTFFIELQAIKDKEQKELEDKAIQTGETEVAIVNDVKSLTGDFASTSVSKKATYEVIDLSKVPLEFLTIDDAKVKEHLKSNFNNPPPGLRYYHDITISHR